MKYHKINGLFKRDKQGKFTDEFADPTFEALWDNVLWNATEKVDGTNIRLYKDGTIGGRTDNAQIPAKLLDTLNPISEHLQSLDLPEDTVLYGEGYGAGIQSGGHYREDQGFVLFDVMIGGNFLERHNVDDIASKLSIKSVPALANTRFDGNVMVRYGHTLKQWYEAFKYNLMTEHSILHTQNGRLEGVILTPQGDLKDRMGKRIITKLKHKDFIKW